MDMGEYEEEELLLVPAHCEKMGSRGDLMLRNLHVASKGLG